MSVNDLATIGHSLGFSPTLDNTKSMKYNATFATPNGAACSGNGLTNNSANGIVGATASIVSAQNLALEFRPY